MMDIPNDWDSEATQIVEHIWPETLDTSSITNNNIISPPTLAPVAGTEDAPVPVSDILSFDQDTPGRWYLSRFVDVNFNKPNLTNQRPILNLMSDYEIESTRNFELYRLHAVSFELNQGDTLVFVDFPISQNAGLSKADCNGITYKSQQLRVHSSNLLDTGSSKFAEMLGPTNQFRTLRRRKLVNKLPEGVKYVLDLTPPSEGDELVFQMTELSLTPGIMKWWSSSLRSQVDSWLVCGHDDICMCDRLKPELAKDHESQQSAPSASPSQDAPAHSEEKEESKFPKLPLRSETALRMKARSENEVYETPPYRRILDYCPVRHRNGIIRLLMLLEGKGVILDSATRIWTLVKLSTIFDCESVLRDRVAQWIMHGPNTRFIEVLPEETLQIAFSLKLPGIAQCAFRILVNELALKLAATRKEHKDLVHTTIFGRRLGDLPDELSNLVQHAARALVDRVSDVNAKMRNRDMYEFWDIEDWNTLRAIEQLLENEKTPLCEDALDKLRFLKDALVYEVTDAFDAATTQTATYIHAAAYETMDEDLLTYVDPKDFDKITMLMLRFNPIQMLLCPIAYNEIGETLDSRTFRHVKCKLPGFTDMRMQDLVDEATETLRAVVICEPSHSQDPDWASCVRIDPYSGGTSLARDPIVSLDAIEIGIKNAIRPLTVSWIRTDIEPPLNVTRHLLLTLTNNELKYLPLWAGGCDDGTGGVFEDLIPMTEMGPNGPGPAFHTGRTVPSTPSSVSGSMIEDMDALRMWGSTTAASIAVHDSISTVYRPDQVITDDETIVSESFTAGGSEYQDARFEEPADHQSMGDAVETAVEAADEETRSVTEGRDTPSAVDDDFDDIYCWNADGDGDGDSDDSMDSVVMIGK
ncbi:hypothetical protein FZEAL_9244 [Fusarium zealandicum]|uniref:Uncharacterized protein n=1 Tax=Fusarium zealandicum TaxID=1053134 RepID=A0A8H4UC68_9HYPO|nr:hypothetical protein FZEAL_9244 [Fusarium zealandicum]